MSTELKTTTICDILPNDTPVMGLGAGFHDRHVKDLASRSSLRRRIYDLAEALPPLACEPSTLMGIEVEVENIIMREDERFKIVPWAVKRDGSLRNNGMEFISLPIRPEDLKLSLATLYAWFGAAKQNPDFSGRTSIHIHLEVNKLTVEEYQKLLLLYLTFEESLFEFARPGRRETNIFCTPLSRTRNETLGKVIRAKTIKEFLGAFKMATNSIQKYSAVNLSHLYHYGTIEFRHLGGEADPVRVMKWANLLLRLFKATEMDIEVLKERITALNTDSTYKTFSQQVFGPQAHDLEFDGLDGFMARGITLCKELLSATPIPQAKTKRGIDLFYEKEQAKSGPAPAQEEDIFANPDPWRNGEWLAPGEHLWNVLIHPDMDDLQIPRANNRQGWTKRVWVRRQLWLERTTRPIDMERARTWANHFDVVVR